MNINRNHIRVTIVAFALACMASMVARAQHADPDTEIAVEALVADDNVYAGVPFQFLVRVSGSQSPSRPTLPSLNWIQFQFLGGQSETRSSSVYTPQGWREERFEGYVFQYEAVADDVGRYTISPVSVTVSGKQYESDAIHVDVLEPSSVEGLRFEIEVDNDQPYLGEPVTFTVKMYLLQSIRSPRFRFPGLNQHFEIRSVAETSSRMTRNAQMIDLLGSLTPAESSRVSEDGVNYTLITMTKTLYPRASGAVTIRPATLSCSVITRRARSLFENDVVERRAVKSNELHLNVKPVPSFNQKGGASVLVSPQIDLKASASVSRVRVGDPIELDVTVTSAKPTNVEPDLDPTKQPSLAGKFRIDAEDQTPIEQQQGRVFQYRWIIRPLEDGITEIPPIELPYFNTKSGRYEIARSDPISLEVQSTNQVTVYDGYGNVDASGTDTPIESLDGGLAHNFNGPDLLKNERFLWSEEIRRPMWIAALVAPPALYLTLLTIAFVRRKKQDGAHDRQRRRALRNACRILDQGTDWSGIDAKATADACQNAIAQYVADRFGRPAAGLTSGDCIAQIEQVDHDLADRVAEILAACESARYGGSLRSETGAPHAMTDLAESTRAILNDVDRRLAREGR